MSRSANGGSGLLLAYRFGLLYEQLPVLDPAALSARLGDTPTASLIRASESSIELVHSEASGPGEPGASPRLISITRSPDPVNQSEYAAALQQTWDWPDGEAALARCRCKLLISDSVDPGLAYKARYAAISRVIVAVAELTKPTACHWEPAGCLVDPDRLSRRLSWGFNVRLVRFTNTRESIMDTLGLAALGLLDVQCRFRELDAADMALWMYRLGIRLFNDGDFMADGDTVAGVDPTEQWICRHQKAIMPPERPVLDIEPTARHSGERSQIIWGAW
jgi:hypothetical protein